MVRVPKDQVIYWVLLARLYTRATVIVSPVLFALYASRFPHQISVALFSEALSFSISSGPIELEGEEACRQGAKKRAMASWTI
jgi:hypothetical protein